MLVRRSASIVLRRVAHEVGLELELRIGSGEADRAIGDKEREEAAIERWPGELDVGGGSAGRHARQLELRRIGRLQLSGPGRGGAALRITQDPYRAALELCRRQFAGGTDRVEHIAAECPADHVRVVTWRSEPLVVGHHDRKPAGQHHRHHAGLPVESGRQQA